MDLKLYDWAGLLTNYILFVKSQIHSIYIIIEKCLPRVKFKEKGYMTQIYKWSSHFSMIYLLSEKELSHTFFNLIIQYLKV